MSTKDSDLIQSEEHTSSHARQLAMCSMKEARELVPYQLAKEKSVLPLGLTNTGSTTLLTVACPKEIDPEDIKELRFISGCTIETTALEQSLLQRAIYRAYKGDTDELTEDKTELNSHAESIPTPADTPTINAHGPVAKFLSGLIEYAIAHDASDIHIAPLRDGSLVKLRIHGIIHQHAETIGNKSTHKQLINRIKVLARLDSSTTNCAQESEFELPELPEGSVIRVSLIPTIHGEKASMRLLGTQAAPKLERLGFASRVTALLSDTLIKQQGAVICCGPTGSGKTTTLYALLEQLTHQNLQIATIEDPVEYRLTDIAQTSVNEKNGMSYAQCMRAVLRQDPDVILVGEVRDPECARVCIEAALSGHLLLGSTHANGVVACLMRFQEFGIQLSSLLQSLRAIMFQQLVPCLCDECKVLDLESSKSWGHDVFKAVGCHTCDYSGIRERVPCAEVLVFTQELLYHCSEPGFRVVDLPKYYSDTHYISMHTQVHDLFCAGKICFLTYQRFNNDFAIAS